MKITNKYYLLFVVAWTLHPEKSERNKISGNTGNHWKTNK